MTVLTSGAAPCANPECRTTEGYVKDGKFIRVRGLCMRCYLRCWQSDVWPDYVSAPTYAGRSARPWVDLNNPASIGKHIWTGDDGERQQHAVYPHHFDARAEIAEAEHDAARWLMNHVHAPLLEWPDPSLALFGAANAQADAA